MAPPPEWLARLANSVAEEMHPVDLLAPVGCHHFHDADAECWEISIFAARTAVAGGPNDGAITHSGFHVDLSQLQTLFDDVVAFHWQALPLSTNDDIGSHIAIEGIFEGHRVWLRVLALAPDQFPVGRQADAYAMRLDDLWSSETE